MPSSLDMWSTITKLPSHAAFPMVLPFAVYIAFLFLDDIFSSSMVGAIAVDTRLLYPVKIACVALLLLIFWKRYTELAKFKLRPREWMWGVAVGIAVFLLWINMSKGWMNIGESTGFDPRNAAGEINWSMALPRLIGAALVVPIMEELFWRSFLLRWIAHPRFIDVTPAQVGLKALILSSVVFGVEHALWLAGILAGLAYGWLYMKSNNLWVPILAHAVTNGMLGLWVLHTGQWAFW